MATKKTNSKTAKKTVVKKEETITESKELKKVENMSVDEITDMFIQNDTQMIEHLKEENTPEPVVDQSQNPEPEKENRLEKLLNEVVKEQPKKTVKTDSVQPRQRDEKKPENEKPVQTQKQPNTNRAVYGYDHFGMIYGY